ncbi:unnamed protein product, partial [Symbiodinium pilosum]
MPQHPGTVPATMLPEHHPHFQQQFAPQRCHAPPQTAVPATMLPDQHPHMTQPNFAAQPHFVPPKLPGVPATMLPGQQPPPMQQHAPPGYIPQQPAVPATMLPEHVQMQQAAMMQRHPQGQPLHELQPPQLDHRIQELLKQPEHHQPEPMPGRDSIQIYQVPPPQGQ